MRRSQTQSLARLTELAVECICITIQMVLALKFQSNRKHFTVNKFENVVCFIGANNVPRGWRYWRRVSNYLPALAGACNVNKLLRQTHSPMHRARYTQKNTTERLILFA